MKRNNQLITFLAADLLLVQAADRAADVEQQMLVVENRSQRKVFAICIITPGSKEIVPAII